MISAHFSLLAVMFSSSCAWDDAASRTAFASFIASHGSKARVLYHGCTFSFLMSIGDKTSFLQEVRATGKLAQFGYVMESEASFTREGKIISRIKSADGANSRYTFSLKDKGDGTYRLADLSLGPPQNLLLQLHAPIGDPMAGVLFSEMPSSDGIQFISWTDGSFGGLPCKVLNAIVPYVQNGTTSQINAMYYFSTQHGVCIGATLRSASSQVAPYVEEQNEYILDGAFPVLKRRVRFSCTGAAPAKRQVQLAIDVLKLDAVAFVEERTCSLSAFGLEEPHGVTWPKPTPYWLYGTILAMVMIFLAILLMRWALKPKAT